MPAFIINSWSRTNGISEPTTSNVITVLQVHELLQIGGASQTLLAHQKTKLCKPADLVDVRPKDQTSLLAARISLKGIEG